MNGEKNKVAHMKKKGILDRLKDGPVLGDGGYLLELEKQYFAHLAQHLV